MIQDSTKKRKKNNNNNDVAEEHPMARKQLKILKVIERIPRR